MKNIKNEQIIDAAIRLLVSQGTAVPTAKIAKEAGVSNGTLFNYYTTKQDLLDVVYLTIKEEVFVGIINEDAHQINDVKEFTHYVWQEYIRWAMANPMRQRVALLLRSSQVISDKAQERIDELFSYINRRFEQAQQAGLIKDIPTNFLCEIAGAQITATINHAVNNQLSEQAITDLTRQSFEIYWSGIAA